MTKALVFDIKRFGVNDGNGIRTVLFLKGCPLRCRWCQNPEGLTPGINVWYARSLCILCRSCAAACPEKCIGFDEEGVRIDHDACTRCGACIQACPTGALRFDAQEMTVAEAMREILKDEVFYRTAGGGVTLSGGDPAFSPGFSAALLKACRERGIGTAAETSLYASPDVADTLADACDEVIADIKLIDPKRHKAATGRSNAVILRNIRRLAARGATLRLRTPLIPGFTADEENIAGIADFIASVDPSIPYELINFNPMCREKYRSLRWDYGFDSGQKPFSPSEMQGFKAIAESRGLHVL